MNVELWKLRSHSHGSGRKSRCFIEQFFTVMPNEEHFFFGERALVGDAGNEMLTRVTEVTYGIL